MKISREFIRKVYRLGMVDTRNYRYLFLEMSFTDSRYPSIARFKINNRYEMTEMTEEYIITDPDILHDEIEMKKKER